MADASGGLVLQLEREVMTQPLNAVQFETARFIMDNLRAAIRAYNIYRKKYPGGIDDRLTPEQHAEMDELEQAVEWELKESGM